MSEQGQTERKRDALCIKCDVCRHWIPNCAQVTVCEGDCNLGVSKSFSFGLSGTCAWFEQQTSDPQQPCVQPSAPTESDPNGLASNAPGAKNDLGKNRLGLCLTGFVNAITMVGWICTYGANKYSPNGWKRVENAKDRYLDAMFRHLFKRMGGEVVDTESGYPHMAHVAWNALALLEFELDADEQKAVK